MENIELPINQPKKTSKKKNRLFEKLREFIFDEKLLNPLGLSFLLIISILIAFAIKQSGFVIGALLLIAIVGMPILYAIIVYPKFGIIVLLIAAYIIMGIIRIGINFPLGTLMDALQALLILGFLVNQKFHPNWKIFKDPISFIILIWIAYNLFEFFNPIAESRLAWVYTIRSVAVVMLTYFIFTYYIRTVEFIRIIIKVWLALSIIAAAWAFKQEHFGFFNYEAQSLDSDLIRNLLFIDGHWRKFSIFSDPTAFSYNMVISILLCLALMTLPISIWKKIILGGMIVFFIQTMLYSGTRGAYVLLPVGVAMFAILNYSKKILALAIAGAFFLIILIFMPTSNPTLHRFQSAFKPSNDASFNVRKMNQKRIQPYILTHPIGGGLGATGVWGQRFSPNSFLANFPPDSGYLRVAVELGWIGLFIICTLMFIVLKTGIENFFKIKNPELKSYCLAMVLIVFALNIGNYPQEALVQFPINIYFYLVVALINITLRLDQQDNQILHERDH
ncbi:O-antigen ligase family protein [Rubrolithibacter danxiaensis]|uniref:O-antigen ligase family protein n=1 Tax=Rubrolithibacter danxiaensis TaxID=3390805 RepID=UPI003BF8DA9B